MPFEYGINTPSSIYDKIQELYNNDVIMLASAGNCNPYSQDCNFIRPPARISYVYGIGAIDQDNYHWFGSPLGNEIDFVTYSVDVEVSYGNETTSNYEVSTGTSFSVGIAGGVASLLKSYRSDLSNEEVRFYLKQSAIGLGKKEIYGAGLPQPYIAMVSIDDNTPPVIDFYTNSLEQNYLTLKFQATEITGIRSCFYEYRNINDTSYSSFRECNSNLPQFGDFLNKVTFTVIQYDISLFIEFNFSLYDLNNNSVHFNFSLELTLPTTSSTTTTKTNNSLSLSISISEDSIMTSEKVLSIISQSSSTNSSPAKTPILEVFIFLFSVFPFVIIRRNKNKKRL